MGTESTHFGEAPKSGPMDDDRCCSLLEHDRLGNGREYELVAGAAQPSSSLNSTEVDMRRILPLLNHFNQGASAKSEPTVSEPLGIRSKMALCAVLRNPSVWAIALTLGCFLAGVVGMRVYGPMSWGRRLVIAGMCGGAGALTNILAAYTLYNILTLQALATGRGTLCSGIERVVHQVLLDEGTLNKYIIAHGNSIASNIVLGPLMQAFFATDDVAEILRERIRGIHDRPETLHLATFGIDTTTLEQWTLWAVQNIWIDVIPLVEDKLGPHIKDAVSTLHAKLGEILQERIASLRPKDVRAVTDTVLQPYASWFSLCGAAFGITIGALAQTLAPYYYPQSAVAPTGV